MPVGWSGRSSVRGSELARDWRVIGAGGGGGLPRVMHWRGDRLLGCRYAAQINMGGIGRLSVS